MTKTEIQEYTAIYYIRDACREVLGFKSTPELEIMLAAQSALETGRWKSMYGWNFGNLRAGSSWSGEVQTLEGADEIIDGKVVTGPDVEKGFRAYDSAAAGALDFVRFLCVDTTPHNGKPNRYAQAVGFAAQGLPNSYALGLSKAGYYTASVDKYARAIAQLYREFWGKYGPAEEAPVEEESTAPHVRELAKEVLLCMVAGGAMGTSKEVVDVAFEIAHEFNNHP